MGINCLRESIRFKGCKYDRIKTPAALLQSIGKRPESQSSSRTLNLKSNEYLIGNTNGFLVTKIFQIRRRKKQCEPQSTIQISGQRSTSDCCRAPTDSKLRMIKVASRYAQKRKMLSPDKSTSQAETSDFESNLVSKKIKMDSDQPCSVEIEAQVSRSPVQLQTQMIETQKVTPEKRKDLDCGDGASATEREEIVKESCTSTPLSRSPPARKRRKTLPPVENKLSNAIRYEDACLRTTWQSNFLRKCAELVEVRFSGPIKITCVKPFYVQFTTCWQDSNAVLHLETSTLPGHKESMTNINEYDNCTDAFSAHETEILVRNFFQISKAYSLRHPYLIACIQTGLETRKEIYDFNRFRTAHQIVEKLCVDIPEKDSRACIMQLRTLLMPQMLPYTHFEAEKVIAHLFAGFGPDWNTISKLTGFNQITLKTAVALYHKLDLGSITPQVWFDVHQRILDAYEIGLDSPKCFQLASKHRSPQHTPLTPCEPPPQYYTAGDINRRKRLKLPSFNSIFSPL